MVVVVNTKFPNFSMKSVKLRNRLWVKNHSFSRSSRIFLEIMKSVYRGPEG